MYLAPLDTVIDMCTACSTGICGTPASRREGDAETWSGCCDMVCHNYKTAQIGGYHPGEDVF
jgi:hypothetical protein